MCSFQAGQGGEKWARERAEIGWQGSCLGAKTDAMGAEGQNSQLVRAESRAK